MACVCPGDCNKLSVQESLCHQQKAEARTTGNFCSASIVSRDLSNPHWTSAQRNAFQFDDDKEQNFFFLEMDNTGSLNREALKKKSVYVKLTSLSTYTWENPHFKILEKQIFNLNVLL